MDVPVYGIEGRVVEIFLERPGSDEAQTVLWLPGQTGLVGAVAAGLNHTVRFSPQYNLFTLVSGSHLMALHSCQLRTE